MARSKRSRGSGTAGNIQPICFSGQSKARELTYFEVASLVSLTQLALLLSRILSSLFTIA